MNDSDFENLLELATKNGPTEVLNVVQSMYTDFNIQPKIVFICDHILPALNAMENPDEALAKLQTSKIHPSAIVLAIITNCLNNQDIQSAFKFAKNHQMFYGLAMIQQRLLSASKATADVQGFVSFVRLISSKLWHEYSSEDGISPQQQFKSKLIDLLKANNMKVPFELQRKR